MTHTPEEKKAYFQNLRNRWTLAKEYAKQEEIKAAWLEAQKTTSGTFSLSSFALVYSQLKEQQKDGTPYIDTKTFDGWKKSGFMVKKGEKSTISGITWLNSKQKEGQSEIQEKEITFLFWKRFVLNE